MDKYQKGEMAVILGGVILLSGVIAYKATKNKSPPTTIHTAPTTTHTAPTSTHTTPTTTHTAPTTTHTAPTTTHTAPETYVCYAPHCKNIMPPNEPAYYICQTTSFVRSAPCPETLAGGFSSAVIACNHKTCN